MMMMMKMPGDSGDDDDYDDGDEDAWAVSWIISAWAPFNGSPYDNVDGFDHFIPMKIIITFGLCL